MCFCRYMGCFCYYVMCFCRYVMCFSLYVMCFCHYVGWFCCYVGCLTALWRNFTILMSSFPGLQKWTTWRNFKLHKWCYVKIRPSLIKTILFIKIKNCLIVLSQEIEGFCPVCGTPLLPYSIVYLECLAKLLLRRVTWSIQGMHISLCYVKSR